MATLINLNDLLRHEILDLYSAEEQIIEALPKMIEKASNGNLKKALSDHLKVTEQQKKRLDQVKELLGADPETGDTEENKGFFSRMFGGSHSQKCRGTEGLIEEGEKMMGEEMSPEALDAAIIASAQKIEHYEISGYGTARAFARELNLVDVANLLTQTLNEEYQADDSLTQLAVGRLNIEAEYASGVEDTSGNGRHTKERVSSGNGSSSTKRARSNGRSSNEAQKSTPSKKQTGRNKSKTGGKTRLTTSSKKSTSKNTPSKSSAKKTTVKGRSSAGKSVKKSAVSRRSSGTRTVSVRSTSPSKSISKSRGGNKNASKSSSSRKSSASKRARSVGRR